MVNHLRVNNLYAVNLDLHKFGSFYINKHLTNAYCIVTMRTRFHKLTKKKMYGVPNNLHNKNKIPLVQGLLLDYIHSNIF